jgi:bacterioferritin (cytochrome b1)
MDVNQFLRSPGSRRAFFRGAGVTFVAGAPVLIAGCGDDGGTPAKMGPADVDVLNSALDFEYTSAAAYRAGAPLLHGAMLAAARQFLEQEEAHAARLVEAIKQLGGVPNKRRATYQMPSLTSQRGFLSFANTLENTAVAAYIDAIPKLSDPALRATAAAIMTNEAEHMAVLLGGLHRPPVPEAFVVGDLQ